MEINLTDEKLKELQLEIELEKRQKEYEKTILRALLNAINNKNHG